MKFGLMTSWGDWWVMTTDDDDVVWHHYHNHLSSWLRQESCDAVLSVDISFVTWRRRCRHSPFTAAIESFLTMILFTESPYNVAHEVIKRWTVWTMNGISLAQIDYFNRICLTGFFSHVSLSPCKMDYIKTEWFPFLNSQFSVVRKNSLKNN